MVERQEVSIQRQNARKEQSLPANRLEECLALVWNRLARTGTCRATVGEQELKMEASASGEFKRR